MLNLAAAGLNQTEAKCYAALLGKKDWKPAELAKNVNETRTNCYKILDNLVALGLAERFDKDKKLHYRAANPGALLQLARDKRTAQERAEKELELSAEGLLERYYKLHGQAGIRQFQGEDGIRQLHDELARSKEPVRFIGSNTDSSSGLVVEAPLQALLKKHRLQPDEYTVPVAWAVTEDKVCIIVHGTETFGLVIQNQLIAEAFKQLFKLLESGHTPRA